jgi:glycosyltransferase involved in cell wall biosynthesis
MRGETILCVAYLDWHGLWRSNQQIISRIAAQNRVFYFEPGRTTDKIFSVEIIRKLPNLFKVQPQQLHENLILVPTPPSLPLARQLLPRSVLQITTPLITKMNAFILIRQIRRTMSVFNVAHPILWLYDPHHFQLVGQFGEKLSCYYNHDEVADITPNARIRDLVQRFDDSLSSRVDVVFATSSAQCKRRKKLNPNAYFIPNGVDFELFNRALTSDLPLPVDMDLIPRPIIGFAGWLSYHIDVCLLCRLAEAYPDCSLVLVGPDELLNSKDTKRLRSLPNVFFLGRKDRTELPSYLRAFDVALMPWQLTGHILSAYPLKLHEYLAAGRSIVATALPELVPYNHLIRITQTHEEFIGCIPDALEDHDPAAIQARVATARKNTWDHRVTEIHDILDRQLSNSQG